MSMDRGTGGTRFLDSTATREDLAKAVLGGLEDLQHHADSTCRRLDLGEVTMTTSRIRDGRISVTVSADLADA